MQHKRITKGKTRVDVKRLPKKSPWRNFRSSDNPKGKASPQKRHKFPSVIQRTAPMRAKMDPTSAPQGTIPEFKPIDVPLVFDEVELEFEESDTVTFEFEFELFTPLLTGEDVKSTVGSLDTVFHVPPDVVVLGSYANDLTTPSLPSIRIAFVLAVKLAPRSTGGAERVLVVLEMTLRT